MPHPILPRKVLIDGAFFQIGRSGIAQVWTHLLQQWLREGMQEEVVVLDRVRTFPRLPGLQVIDAPSYNYHDPEADRRYIQTMCDEVGADVFISTYYSHPIHTPSVLMVHDMIPEVLGWNLSDPMWVQKRQAMDRAAACIAVSHNTANDLARHLHRPDLPVTVAHNGCDLQPAASDDVLAFRRRMGLWRPYFMLSGSPQDYKNGTQFFEALAQLGDKRAEYAVLCTGGGELPREWLALAGAADVKICILSDDDMPLAYSGAIALVYPSLYEGFGLPVLEAMACGCPVICADTASLPEVGGDAPLYVHMGPDAERAQVTRQLADALMQVQLTGVRQPMILKGLQQARGFTWVNMARQVAQVLRDTAQARATPAHLAPDDVMVQFDGFALDLPRGHLLTQYLAEHGQYDRFLPTLASHLPSGSVVIDVGANCGDTLCAMAMRQPELHVVAIEPDPDFHRYLKHNTQRLQQWHPQLRVDCVQSLVGVAGKQATLQGGGGSRHAAYGEAPQAHSLATQALDDIAQTVLGNTHAPIALLKSDVDGFDHDVLASAQTTLVGQQPLVFFECLTSDAQQHEAYHATVTRLQEAGYRHYWVFDNYGNTLMETVDPAVVTQVLDYVWRQRLRGVTRTFYYVDILAAPPQWAELARQAVAAHNARAA